jgi:alpha-aminoadipic semialdehyde synthase
MEGRRGVIGIRRENKTYWEGRTPLTPDDVRTLISDGVKVIVQPSSLRCFSDIEYIQAGAEISEDLSECSTIAGIKEVDIELLLPRRTYLFFAHVIKGQPYNMGLLDALLAKGIRHIDYECIRDTTPQRNRLVAFGVYAGNAGVIDFISGLGELLLNRHISTPFIYIARCYRYRTLDIAKDDIRAIGHSIADDGLPSKITPLVFGVTGTGRCANGAMEILRLLPHEVVRVADLPALLTRSDVNHKVFIVELDDSFLVKRKDGGAFDKTEYRSHPGLYRGALAELLPYLSVIVNSVFWTTKYPHFLSSAELKEATEAHRSRLLGVCDISCDLRGSIEFVYKFMTPDEPFYLYNPLDDRMYFTHSEFAFDSVLFHSVDFLPSELPFDASKHFGSVLRNHLKALAYDESSSLPFEAQTLPEVIKNAVVTCNGALTPNFEYIADIRAAATGGQSVSTNTEDEDVDLIDELKDLKFGHSLSEEALGMLERILASQ